jgi:hypothetical protein
MDSSINSATDAVAQFEKAMPPRALHFVVVVTSLAGNDHHKRMILGEHSLSNPPCVGDRVARVNGW